MLPGAYIPTPVPISWKTRLAAVQAWLGNDCMFSHRTAGALLGLDGVPTDFVEVVCHRGRRQPGVVVHRLLATDRPGCLLVGGFPITDTERTILDLFAVMGRSTAALALDDALRKRLTTLERLWDTYGEVGGRGRNGSASFRRALLMRDDRDGSLASRMETMFHRILRGLPPPVAVPQHAVETSGGRFYLDFAYPHVKLGLEAHSIRWHLGVEKAKRDLVRDRLLKRSGWTILYFSWDDLRFRREETAEEILEVRTKLERGLL